MDTTELPPDFKEFLRFLGEHGVRYLLVGGYAVGYYGYVRTTGDLDVWIATDPENSRRMVEALRQFGFGGPQLTPDLFVKFGKMVRMGVAPVRIEVLTDLSGVDFEPCYAGRVVATIDGTPCVLINLTDLKKNKLAAGRPKDLEYLQQLP